VFERKSLKWPILVAILMIVMLVGLTIGWVLLNVFSALDAEKTSRSAIYWILLSVGAVFFACLLAGVWLASQGDLTTGQLFAFFATAAVLALEGGLAVQDVPYARLRERLLRDGQVLEHRPAPSP
jgi:Kef-type K+ transport system membrane component KefB